VFVIFFRFYANVQGVTVRPHPCIPISNNYVSNRLLYDGKLHFIHLNEMIRGFIACMKATVKRCICWIFSCNIVMPPALWKLPVHRVPCYAGKKCHVLQSGGDYPNKPNYANYVGRKVAKRFTVSRSNAVVQTLTARISCTRKLQLFSHRSQE